MNRDAKIGIVVVLIVVGLLVIILVKGDPDRGEAETSIEQAVTPPPDSIEPDFGFIDSPFEHLDQLAQEREEARRVRPDRTRPEEPETRRTPDRSPADEPEEREAEPETQPERAAERTPDRTPERTAARESTDASQDDIWEYTVKPGDTISEISQRELGTVRRWAEIAALNDLSEPYAIRVDQKLKMPPRGASVSVDEPTRTTATTRTPTEREMVGRERYVVRPNDIKDVMEIARRQLGDWKEWRTIAELSGLAPPFEISTGDVLWLPVYE